MGRRFCGCERSHKKNVDLNNLEFPAYGTMKVTANLIFRLQFENFPNEVENREPKEFEDFLGHENSKHDCLEPTRHLLIKEEQVQGTTKVKFSLKKEISLNFETQKKNRKQGQPDTSTTKGLAEAGTARRLLLH